MMETLILMKHELPILVLLFLLLLLKIASVQRNDKVLLLIQGFLFVQCIAGFVMPHDGNLFGTMFTTNAIIQLEKNILNIALLLLSLLFTDWLKTIEHLVEFFILLLSSVLGMFFLLSSAHLLQFYLSLELSTIPVAALASFHLKNKLSSEAAIKMILSSAFSSGILLFGISLIYGVTGSLEFSTIASAIQIEPLSIMAFVFLISAFAFKMSVVPFHLWTADVYEGAPIAVTAFLSVLSKATISFAFLSVLYVVFSSYFSVWHPLLVGLSCATIFIGNLFAVRQQNIKRFLAFSSIAQVGFILIGISSNNLQGVASVIYFLLIYVFSNLAAFGVVGCISFLTNKENIDDYKGLYQTNPWMSWILAIALFSLAGIPPTAGFFGKLFLLGSGISAGNYVFITFAGCNMVISLYYYLRIIRVVFIDTSNHTIPSLTVSIASKIGLLICAAGIILVGLCNWFYNTIYFIIQQ